MKKMRKLFVALSICALSAGIQACDDSMPVGNGSVTGGWGNPESCTDYCINDTILSHCENGVANEYDCATSGKICKDNQCQFGTIDIICSGDIKICDNNIYKQCNDSIHDYDIIEDCSLSGKICNPAQGCISENQPCTEADNRCDGQHYYKCDTSTGKLEYIDCEARNLICNSKKGCISNTPYCTDADNKCDNNIMFKCNSETGIIDWLDCSKYNMICDPQKLECAQEITKCQESDNTCVNDILFICNNETGSFETTNCADLNRICDSNTLSCKESGEIESCKKSDNYCDNNQVVHICNTTTGQMETIDCAQKGQICDPNDFSCVDPKCTTDLNACDGNILKSCNLKTGKMETINCAESQKICDPKTISCEYLCDPNTYPTSCANGNTITRCNKEHQIVSEVCNAGEYCIGDSCKKLTPEEECALLGMVYDPKTDSCQPITGTVVGGQCKCTKNCTVEVTGKQIKSYFNPLFISMDGLNELFANLKDTDKITMPNYFPGANNIKGCEELAKVVPDGMSVGCFTDGKFAFPAGLITILRKLPDIKISLIGTFGFDLSTILPESIRKTLNNLADKLEAGVGFLAPNGYCMTGTINIGDKATAGIDAKASLGMLQIPISINVFSKDPLNPKNGLLAGINTGDHQKVLTNSEAAALQGKNYCPEGSTLFSYSKTKPINITKEIGPVQGIDIKGAAVVDIVLNTGFDMCLKSCSTDNDCRKDEGYKCVDIPNGVTGESQTIPEIPTKKACFMESNVEFFKNLSSGSGTP